MSTAPSLFLGGRFSNRLLEANSGNTDDGAAFRLRLRTNRIAPNGTSETATVSEAWLTLTYEAAQTLTVRLLADELVVATRAVSLPAHPALRQRVVPVPFSVPLLVAGVERARVHPRGTWFQLEVESDGTAELAIDGAELLWDAAGRR